MTQLILSVAILGNHGDFNRITPTSCELIIGTAPTIPTCVESIAMSRFFATGDTSDESTSSESEEDVQQKAPVKVPTR